MINPWRQFQQLIGSRPVRTGTVASHNADGTSTLTMTGGGTLRAIGQDVAVGAKAFVRGNEIIGQAPDLTAYNLEV
jgi:hypothetical protein